MVKLNLMIKSLFLLTCLISLILTKKVIVIGAGSSGLTAAKYLKENGYEVTVLEGRSRVGGRTWSNSDLGYTIDLGAAWLHGINDNEVYDLAKEESIKTTLFDYDKRNFKSTTFSSSELEKSFDKLETLSEELSSFITQNTKNLNDDVSLSSQIDQYFMKTSLSASDKAVLKLNIAQEIEGDIGNSAENLSAINYDEGKTFSGSDHLIPGGFVSIFDSFIKDLQIKLNQKISSIEESKGVYTVTTSTGDKYLSDAVVVTVPLGVLKKNIIKFTPELNSNLQTAINKLGMGVYEKLVIEFAENFWGDFNVINFVENPTVPWLSAFNIQSITNKPTLVFLIPGNAKYLPEFYTETKDQIVNRFVSYLKKIYSNANIVVEKSLKTDWKNDEFSYGSYSSIGIGGNQNMRNEFTKQMNGLFFAGEHTRTDYPSTVHGAYRSGVDASKRVVSYFGDSFKDFLELKGNYVLIFKLSLILLAFLF